MSRSLSKVLAIAICLPLTCSTVAGQDSRVPEARDAARHKAPLSTDFPVDQLPQGAVARMGSINLRQDASFIQFTIGNRSIVANTAGELYFWEAGSGKLQRRSKLPPDNEEKWQ